LQSREQKQIQLLSLAAEHLQHIVPVEINVYFYLGNKLEIILSASSGVGGEYFPSGGTGCGGWDDVSSVDGKSGTNFALLGERKQGRKKKLNENHLKVPGGLYFRFIMSRVGQVESFMNG
jgi:hypothetical protein